MNLINRLKYTLLFLIFAANSSFAQTVETDSVENALLWKISGNGIKKPSYIFGTIHVLPKADFFFTPAMEKAFTSCKELIMEVDMEITPELQMQMVQGMMLPDGKSLADYMNKADYDKYMIYLKDSLKLSPLNLFLIPKIKPLFSFTLILQDKLSEPVSFEQYFQKLAKKQKMKISGLESLQEQMDIINSIPVEEQVALITDSTAYDADVLKGYYEMVDWYKAQEINKLKDAADDEKLIRKYSDRLISNRNKYWISIIEEKIKKHPCFIAIGAGHLTGNDGLIKLLRAIGYKLEPVKIF